MTTGKKIAAFRAAKGWTQEELGEAAGVTARTIQRIENGDSQPRAYTLRVLAKALGEEVAELTAPARPFEANAAAPDAISARSFAASAAPAPALEAAPAAPDLAPPPAPDLYLLNLSSFAYLVIPFVHALVPYRIWRKHRAALSRPGRRIVLQQFHWTIALYGLLLLTVAYNLLLIKVAGQDARPYLASYGWVVVFMYALNAVLILRMALRIRRGEAGMSDARGMSGGGMSDTRGMSGK